MSNTTYLKDAFDAVKTFMTIGGQTVNNKPSIPSEADMLLRLRLNIEENLELTEAILGQSASRLEPSSIEAIHHIRDSITFFKAKSHGSKTLNRHIRQRLFWLLNVDKFLHWRIAIIRLKFSFSSYPVCTFFSNGFL